MSIRARDHQMFPALKKAAYGFVLLPALLQSQRPQQPGHLTVTSTPVGAEITIDNQRMRQVTPYTFFVAPGEHRVSSSTVPKCETPVRVTVSAGAAMSVHCAANGWDPPKPVSK
jgi:hypothetical protein